MNRVPKLRFKEFSGEWEEKKLKDIVKINQGLQIPISERLIEQVENSYFYITNEFLKEKSLKKYFILNPSQSVLCTKDDILMTRTGNTGMVVTDVEGAFHNNFFKVAYSSYLTKGFLYNFLKLKRTQNQILKMAGTSTIPDLNHSDFYSISMAFPSNIEQQKIASFLSAIDTRIDQLTRKKELLAQYKKGAMQKIFSQELRFKDEDGSEFPEWEEKQFKNVFKIGSGKDYKHLESGSVPVYGTGGHMLSVSDYLYEGESVCIGRKGTIDKPMFLDGKFWTVDTLFYTHSFKDSIPKFIFYVFQTINWKLYNEASGVPSLSKSTIEKIVFSFPPIEEQIKIANFLSVIDTKINLVAKQLEEVKRFKKGLLGQMFV